MKIEMKRRLWLLVACAVVLLALTSGASRPAQPQDLLTMDRKVNLIEQRLYAMEARLNRIEQQTGRASDPSPLHPAAAATAASAETETALLRNQLDTLSLRLRLIECGLLRLDERTLSPVAREARRKSGAQTLDSCRVNAEAPLQFPSAQ